MISFLKMIYEWIRIYKNIIFCKRKRKSSNIYSWEDCEVVSCFKSGKIASIVSTTVDEEQPGLVVVRSVGDLSENLDPVAEQITRSALSKGYPVLIVWN